nr:hypothetical protein [Paucibacter sp. M5-1]MCZ7884278.1 hypothetical protein [Paucibacter sp. M5-1]
MRAPVDAAAWARISQGFDEALDLAPAQRAAWLAALEASEPEIGAALRRLLAAHEQADDGRLAAAPRAWWPRPWFSGPGRRCCRARWSAATG